MEKESKTQKTRNLLLKKAYVTFMKGYLVEKEDNLIYRDHELKGGSQIVNLEQECHQEFNQRKEMNYVGTVRVKRP